MRPSLMPMVPVHEVAVRRVMPSSSVQSIVVVCDGSPAGDGALRLADALAQSTGARVRAVTWLPKNYSMDGDAPIETFLHFVTQQLYRTTEMVGFWRLELLTGNIPQRLARVCAEESANAVILPETLHAGIIGPRWTMRTGIPAAYVEMSPRNTEEQIVLCSCSDAQSQRHAHVVAALMTAACTMRLTARRRRMKRPCPYVQVQTVTFPKGFGAPDSGPYASVNSSSNSLSLTAS